VADEIAMTLAHLDHDSQPVIGTGDCNYVSPPPLPLPQPISTPSPEYGTGSDTSTSGSAQQAAIYSLALWLFWMIMTIALNGSHRGKAPQVIVVLLFVTPVIGLLLGIVSIAVAHRPFRAGSLLPSVLGISLNGVAVMFLMFLLWIGSILQHNRALNQHGRHVQTSSIPAPTAYQP